MQLKKFKEGFTKLHDDAVVLQKTINKLTPSFKMIFSRCKIAECEVEVEKLNEKLFELDKQRLVEIPDEQPGFNASVA